MKKSVSLMKKLALMCVLALGAAAHAASPAAGSSMSKAIALKSSQVATLVNEYDPEFKEFWDWGGAYYKVKLTRGYSYTVFIQDGNASEIDLFVDTDWEDENAPVASFDSYEYEGGNIKVAYMYADAWDPDFDPASGTYYVYLSGEIGARCTLRFVQGIMSFTPMGADSNPVQLTCTESEQSVGVRTYVDSEDQSVTGYSFSMYMEQGRQYTFKTRKGTLEEPNDIDFNVNGLIERDTTFAAQNAKYYVYPNESREYTFKVYCPSNSWALTKQFDMTYQVAPSRNPKKHRGLNADWEPYELNAGNGYSLDVLPGRMVADKGYYDAVIDESLLRIELKKDERWVFDTVGATNMMMRVYDSAGMVLSEYSSLENGGECRASLSTTEDDWYYVGLCNPLLEYSDPAPTSGVARIVARNVTADFMPDERDDFDSGDDVYTGATLLTAVPGSNFVDTASAQIDGVHILSASDWYDWFAIPCVSGVTYQVQAFYDTDEISSFKLSCKANSLINGVLGKFSNYTGSLSPDSVEPLTFTPVAGGMYYFRLQVKEGTSLDFPPYTVMVNCQAPEGTSLVRVGAGAKGTSARWYVTRDTGAKFDDGAVVALPVSEAYSTYKIKFENPDAATFSTPDAVNTNLLSWAGSQEVVRFTGVFNDVYDPADDSLDVPTGHVTITPTAAAQMVKRTFWSEDPGDWFKIKSEPGVYYNFRIEDTTEDGNGDACFTLFSSEAGSVPVATNVVELKKKMLPVPTGVAKQIYRLGVTHRTNPAVDTSYELHFSSAKVGLIGFDAATYTTKETSAYKILTVTRSASEGAVRVNYATVAGTAKPGVNYYPADGVLSWAAGDMSPKEIKVRLIPEVESAWNNERPQFEVRLWPMPEDCLEDDEYPATFAPGGDRAVVSIKDTSVQNPGSVEIVSTPISYTLTDEADATIRIARGKGADGRISVIAKTIDKEAVAGVDFTGFNLTHTWEDGDDADWVIPLHLNEPSGNVASKRFIVKIAVNETGNADGVPEIPVAKTYFTIRNGKLGLSVDEFAAQLAPFGMKLIAAAEKWHTDASGTSLVSEDMTSGATKAQFAVNGPGFFICKPDVVGGIGSFIGMLSNDGDTQTKEFKVVNGEINTVAVPDWAKVVTFKFKCTTGPAHAEFSPFGGGLPFKWIPLSEISPVAPLMSSVVGVADELVWSAPSSLELADNIWYRVFIGNRGSTVTKITNVATNYTQETSCLAPAEQVGKGSNCWWRIECAHMTDPESESASAEWLQVPSVWKFSVAKDDTPRTGVGTDKGIPWTDVNGDEIQAGKTIELAEGVYWKATLASETSDATSLTLVSGELPPGMEIKAQYCKVHGTPTAAGNYSALFQVWNGNVAGTTLKVNFHVAAMGTAAGAYNGTMLEVGSQLTNAYPRVGRIYNVKIAKDGSVSAQVKIAGRSWKFTGAGLDRVVDRDDSAPGQKMTYEVDLQNVEYLNSVAYTNVLLLSLGSGESANAVACGEVAGAARLTVNLPGEHMVDVQEGIVYEGQLMRTDVSVPEVASAMKSYAGYYTVALVPFGVSPAQGVPCGNGYVTLIVEESGSVTAAGRLADGTSFSCSGTAQVIGDLTDPASCSLHIPLCAYASPWSFGGVLKIRDGVVDSTATLVWSKDGKSSTFDGNGFVTEIHPTGGWYNTTANLQAYYLDRDFFVELERVDGLPAGMLPALPAGSEYTVNTMPSGVDLILEGNTIVAPAKKLVRRENNSALYDLAASVNPWAVTFSFERATGLVSGTFLARYEGDAHGAAATLEHYGVLLMSRDGYSPLDTDVWTAGFCLMPVTTKWSQSLPFNVRQCKVDRDWNEKIIPDLTDAK